MYSDRSAFLLGDRRGPGLVGHGLLARAEQGQSRARPENLGLDARLLHEMAKDQSPKTPTEHDQDPAEDGDAPTRVYAGLAVRGRSARRDPQRRLAWARTYLAADDPQLATICFCDALNDPGLELDPNDALQLAEGLVTVYLRQGEIDDAAELMRFTNAWCRGRIDLVAPVISDSTVVEINPLLG